MFLICPATNLLVDKDSVKYGLRKKNVPQEGYGTRVFEQSIPVWNRLTYPTYVGIQYWKKIIPIRNQYILHTLHTLF